MITQKPPTPTQQQTIPGVPHGEKPKPKPKPVITDYASL